MKPKKIPKISIGSWAYTIGPYADNPVSLAEVVQRLNELGFDGVELGRDSGADMIINVRGKDSEYYVANLADEIKKVSRGRMADRVICATGALEGMQEALEISGGRSTIVYFGLPGTDDVLNVPLLSSLLMDKTIRFSWLSPLTWPHAIQALAQGLIDVQFNKGKQEFYS
ncbi:hypothetical protein KAV79_04900 [Candidatus Aerophobetes bacterium]|nr:hypothetical protein [Candidatus Aerophobetes bacterium]